FRSTSCSRRSAACSSPSGTSSGCAALLPSSLGSRSRKDRSERRGMMNRAAEASDLVDAVVRFCRFLKLWGARIHPDASQAALLALREIDLANRQDFRTALRMAIVHRPEDFPLYDHLFNVFWGAGTRGGEAGRASDAFPNRPVDAKRVGKTVADPEPDGSER